MGMVICFGNVLFPPLSMLGSFGIRFSSVSGPQQLAPVVYFGMVGCLVLVALVTRILGLPLLVIWLLFIWNSAQVLIRWTLMIAGLLLSSGDVMKMPWRCLNNPNVWTDESREDFSSVGGFEVAGAGVYLPASELAFDGLVWRTAWEYGDARLERCRAFVPVPRGHADCSAC